MTKTKVSSYFEGERVVKLSYSRYVDLGITNVKGDSQHFRYEGLDGIKQFAQYINNIINLVEKL